MDEYQLNQMRAEVTQLLRQSEAQVPILALLLAVSRIAKINPKELEAAVDHLPLHPIGANDIKREAKKLIPVYFP